jgi:hypothetical protein
MASMTMNAWWEGNHYESYWMEITDREDLGADLHAPQLDGGAASTGPTVW